MVYNERDALTLSAELFSKCSLTPGQGSTLDELLSPFADLEPSELPSQRSICEEIDKNRFTALVTALKTQRNQAWVHWLMSNKTKGISSWLYIAAKPVPGLEVSPEQFLDSLRTRLLIPPVFEAANITRVCRVCGKEAKDSLHALSCRGMSGIVKTRHDVIAGHIMKYCKAIVNNNTYEEYPINHITMEPLTTANSIAGRHNINLNINNNNGNGNNNSTSSRRLGDNNNTNHNTTSSNINTNSTTNNQSAAPAPDPCPEATAGTNRNARVSDYSNSSSRTSASRPSTDPVAAAVTSISNLTLNGSASSSFRDTRADLKADLFFALPSGNPCFMDLVVTNPATPSTIAMNRDIKPGFGAEQAEKGKVQKYVGRYGEAIRSKLVPFGIEATGRLGPSANKFFADISSNLSDNHDKKEKEKKERNLLARRIAATLVIYNGNLMSTFRGHSTVIPIAAEDYGDPPQTLVDDPDTRDYET